MPGLIVITDKSPEVLGGSNFVVSTDLLLAR